MLGWLGWRALAVALATLLLAPAAIGSLRDTDQPVAHLHWRIVGHQGVSIDGAYTMLWGRGPIVLGTLLNERTGRRAVVRLPRDCRRPGGIEETVGGPWLMADCNERYVGLYSLAGHRWHNLAVRGPCRHRTPSSCPAEAIGSRWIEYDSGTPNRGDVYIFQNIASGAIRRDPATRRVIADLDARRLAHHLCARISVPPDGSLEFGGWFALALYESNTYLERCGTRMHRLLTSSDSASGIGSDLVVYVTDLRGPIHAISLPSLRRFTIALPRRARFVDFLEVGLRHIYLNAQIGNNGYAIFSAAISSLPPDLRGG